MWELDCEEGWALKNWCFWTVLLEKTLESPLNCKEILPVHPKQDQSCMFIGRIDAEAETPILWPPHEKSWLIWKDLDAGKDLRWEKKGTTEDEMAGWHHWLNGHEFEWIPGVGDGQGGMVCCDSWSRKELDTTERLNWTECVSNVVSQEFLLWIFNLSSTLFHDKETYISYWIILNEYRTKLIFKNILILFHWRKFSYPMLLSNGEDGGAS